MNTARARVRSRRCINASKKRVCVQFGHFDDHLTETSIRTERNFETRKSPENDGDRACRILSGGMCERRNCLTSPPMRTTHHHALAHTRYTTIVRFNLRTDFLRSLRHCLRLLNFYYEDFFVSLLSSLFSLPSQPSTRIFLIFRRDVTNFCPSRKQISFS